MLCKEYCPRPCPEPVGQGHRETPPRRLQLGVRTPKASREALVLLWGPGPGTDPWLWVKNFSGALGKDRTGSRRRAEGPDRRTVRDRQRSRRLSHQGRGEKEPTGSARPRSSRSLCFLGCPPAAGTG